MTEISLDVYLGILMDLIPDPVIAIDRQGKIVNANHLFGKFSGHTREQLIGKKFSDLGFVTNECKRFATKNSEEMLTYLCITPCEIKVISKNGQAKYFEAKRRRIEHNGQFLDVVIFHDITQLKNVRKKLQDKLPQENQLKFKSIIDSSFDAIVLFGADDRIIYWNPAAKRMYGFDESEVIGQPLNEKIVPIRLRESYLNFVQNFARGKLDAVEETFKFPGLRKDGTEFSSEISLSSVETDGNKFMVAMVRNITKRKYIHQPLSALKEKHQIEEERRYRALFERIPTSVIVIDPKTTGAVQFNDVAHRQLGYSRQEFAELCLYDYQTVEKRDAIRSRIKDILSKGYSAFETKHRTKDGKIIDVMINASVVELSGRKFLLFTCNDITDFKKSQDMLTNSEEKFRGIANVNKDAIVLVNEKSKITYWNPAAEKIFGYLSQEAIGKEVHKLLTPKTTCKEGKERIKNSVDIFSETGSGYFTVGNVQLVSKRKDGSEFPAELSLSPLKLGGKWNAAGFVKDITERKKAEELLREAEQRYHALFDQAPIGVLIVDPETAGFVEFNDLAHSQLGYSRDEFEKMSILNIEAKESESEIRLHLSEMVKTGGGQFETLHRTKDDKINNVLVIARVIKLANRKLLHCILHDITEIRQVQGALAESETRYRQFVELAQEGVWVLDKNYVTTFVNPRMAQMLGYVESEMVGKCGFDFVDEASIDQAKGILSENSQSLHGEFEYEFHRKDRSKVYTSIRTSQIRDDQGHYWGTLALVADITSRKEMADKLENYSKQLEQLVEKRTKELADTQAQLIKSERLAAIGELAGMVGHDLRNPLTGIKNAAYFLKRKNAFPTPQGKQMLDIIDRCVDHSNKIINDLLDYSKEIRLEREEVSPKQLILDALAMLSIPQKIQVANHIADKPSINVDVEKLTRVFINLVKNAIDSMPDGGTIAVGSVETNDHLEISVSDTGIGIEEQVLPKLFSPLVTTKAQGMGFGLAICKRIIEAHGGMITVKTAKNQGTTFTVTLPLESNISWR